MIFKNYHTHTKRCNHAIGEDREYVEAAIKAGIKTLGFSDHAPQIYHDGYVSSVRMLPEELPEYVSSLTKLKEEYKNDIEILIGLEAEYFPLLFSDLLKLVKANNIDYMILSHHFFGNEFDSIYPLGHICEGHRISSFDKTDSEERLSEYVKSEIEGIKTGVFSYIGHPDAINFTGDEKVYNMYMRQICEAAKEYDLPLELNLLGIQAERHYPRESFWKIAADVGNKAIIGFDAHEPCRFEAYPKTIKKGLKILEKYGIERTEDIKLPLG